MSAPISIVRRHNKALHRTALPLHSKAAGELVVVDRDHRCTDVRVAEKFLDRVNVPPTRFDRIPFDCMLHPDLLEALAPPAAAALRHPGLRVPERTPPATGDPG